jgi:hypothetical protein
MAMFTLFNMVPTLYEKSVALTTSLAEHRYNLN